MMSRWLELKRSFVIRYLQKFIFGFGHLNVFGLSCAHRLIILQLILFNRPERFFYFMHLYLPYNFDLLVCEIATQNRYFTFNTYV